MNEAGKPVDLTVDLAVRRAGRDGHRRVRLIAEPPAITARSVTLLPSGTARQLAAALIVAADQADELDRDVSAHPAP
jgi:type II secretory pathway component PulL